MKTAFQTLLQILTRCEKKRHIITGAKSSLLDRHLSYALCSFVKLCCCQQGAYSSLKQQQNLRYRGDIDASGIILFWYLVRFPLPLTECTFPCWICPTIVDRPRLFKLAVWSWKLVATCFPSKYNNSPHLHQRRVSLNCCEAQQMS